jgi:hypothetical protein
MSNPMPIVIVHKGTRYGPPTFQRIYVRLGALKKGFLAGCFFKGATNGQLLCAIGRDANN